MRRKGQLEDSPGGDSGTLGTGIIGAGESVKISGTSGAIGYKGRLGSGEAQWVVPDKREARPRVGGAFPHPNTNHIKPYHDMSKKGEYFTSIGFLPKLF